MGADFASVSTRNSDPANGSITITAPSGLREFDAMIAAVTIRSILITDIVAPTGWKKLYDATIGSGSHRLAIWSKIATAADAVAADFTFDYIGGTDSEAGFIARFTSPQDPPVEEIRSLIDSTDTDVLLPVSVDFILAPLQGVYIASWADATGGHVPGASSTRDPIEGTWTERVDIAASENALVMYTGDEKTIAEMFLLGTGGGGLLTHASFADGTAALTTFGVSLFMVAATIEPTPGWGFTDSLNTPYISESPYMVYKSLLSLGYRLQNAKVV